MMKEKSSYKFRLVKIVLSIQEFKTYHVFINVISHVFSLISSPCLGALTLQVNISNPEGILDPYLTHPKLSMKTLVKIGKKHVMWSHRLSLKKFENYI